MYMRIVSWLCLCILGGQVYAATETLFLHETSTTERVVVQHDSALNPASGVTIEAWIRPTNTTGCQTIVGKGFETGYWLGICNGKIRYYTNGFNTFSDGPTSITVGKWWHIAVTFDRGTRRYYINGELDFTQSTPGELGVNAAPFGIGGEGGSATFPNNIYQFFGRISEVRLWGYARSQQQIRNTMYQQVTIPEPGLIGVWALEGAADDRFGSFESVLVPHATFDGLDSPPIPHDPLKIRNAASIVTDGSCNDFGYSTVTEVPAWYEEGDHPVPLNNPQKILLGADAFYLYVCLPRRTQLSDPFYVVEIDTQNHGTSLLQNDDYRFRFWPGNGGLSTARGNTETILDIPVSSWVATIDPLGLAAFETVGSEFETDFEMRIPRGNFTDSGAVFRMRVVHDYLVDGGGNRTVVWPVGSSDTNPSTWQEVAVDLSSVGPPDNENPVVTLYGTSRRSFLEDVPFRVFAQDDVDIAVLELVIDGVVVESLDATGGADDAVEIEHADRYSVGRHLVHARAIDHVGRIGYSRFDSFFVDVDGERPRVAVWVEPANSAPGQTVTVFARAIDADGVKNIQIENLLGGLVPSAKYCDFPSGVITATCEWTITPDASVTQVRMIARATDWTDYSGSSNDQLILFGNDGPDTDNDGLSDHVENALCTSRINPDTDTDGLSDGWEVLGIPFDDGSSFDLLPWGANPCWKNLLLRLDYETGAEPPETGIDNLRNQYRDNSIRTVVWKRERPQPTVYDQSHISSTTAVYQRTELGDYYFDPKKMWAFYYGYEHNLAGRSVAWNRFFTIDHYGGTKGYCSSGPSQYQECRGDFECAGGAACAAGCTGGTNAGHSCTEAGDCPLVDGSFASCTAPCVTAPGATGPACTAKEDLDYRLFHELGHTAGLGHGGFSGTQESTSNGGFISVDSDWVSENYKPHQLSAMNYLYNQGRLCMNPLPSPIPDGFKPDLNGVVTYLEDNLGGLNEERLFESGGFDAILRTQDCSHATPGAVPVFLYTCKFDDTKYLMLSDGEKTIARVQQGGDWDFSLPAHDPGIDWNCNGVIDTGIVAENIDGSAGVDDSSIWQEDLWSLDDTLSAQQEFSVVPNPANCLILYRADCSDRAKSCYVWPQEYRDEIPTLASGLAPVDCRDLFMATRDRHYNADCRGGSDDDFGIDDCDPVIRDAVVSSKLDNKHWIGSDGIEIASGIENDIGPEHNDYELPPPLPGVEQCDLSDNDGDGEIDEGCRDQDSDGMPDVIDNCKITANPDQADRDDDGLGDVCQFPTLNNLVATWDGGRTVNLLWDDDGVPLRGVVVYRYGVTHPSPQFRGDSYPTAVGSAYADAVGAGDTYTYVVRPLNLNGVEGEPVSTTVFVDINEEVFKDSFESP